MNILLIGGGGREHALAWKLAQSPKVEKIYAAPGNPGMALLPKCECIALDVENLEGVADYAEEKSIDLTVVGPEAPLVAGLADVCNAAVCRCSVLLRLQRSWKVPRHFPKS